MTKLRTVYILGAGFTRAILNKNKFHPPLLKDLSLEIINKLKQKNTSGLIDDLLKITYDRRKIGLEQNIELFLTHLELLIYAETDYTKKKELQDIKEDVEQMIVKELEKLKPQSLDDYEYGVADEFVNLLQKDDTIITFNYDTCLETLLWLTDKWSPFGGYFENDNTFLTQKKKNKDLLNIQVLKLHGSINFVKASYYNPTGKDLNYQYKYYVGVKIDDLTFPGIHANSSVALPEGPYIITPSYLKIYGGNHEIQTLWQKAFKCLSSAFRIVIIGYSFPEADIQSRMLFSFVGTKSNLKVVKCRVIIVSPEAERIWNEVRQYLIFHESYINRVILPRTLEEKIVELKKQLSMV